MFIHFDGLSFSELPAWQKFFILANVLWPLLIYFILFMFFEITNPEGNPFRHSFSMGMFVVFSGIGLAFFLFPIGCSWGTTFSVVIVSFVLAVFFCLNAPEKNMPTSEEICAENSGILHLAYSAYGSDLGSVGSERITTTICGTTSEAKAAALEHIENFKKNHPGSRVHTHNLYLSYVDESVCIKAGNGWAGKRLVERYDGVDDF